MLIGKLGSRVQFLHETLAYIVVIHLLLYGLFLPLKASSSMVYFIYDKSVAFTRQMQKTKYDLIKN